MPSPERRLPVPLAAGAQTDPVRLIRYSLERRQFTSEAVLSVAGPSAEFRRECMLFEAESFMESEPDRLTEMVVNFLGSLHSAGLEVVLWIHSDGRRTRFFYGAVEPPVGASNPVRNELVRKGLEGFYLGAQLRNVPCEEVLRRSRELLDRTAVGTVLGVPSDREATKLQTRLDDALEALTGTPFDVILQCVPAPREIIDLAEENLSFISNVAHQLSKATVSQADTRSFSESVSVGITEGESASRTRSWSTSKTSGTSREVQGSAEREAGAAVGMIVGAAIGGLLGSIAAPGAGTKIGVNAGIALGNFVGDTAAATLNPPVQEQESATESEGMSDAATRTSSASSSHGETAGTTLSRQVSFEAANRQARALEELAEAHLGRYRRARGVGSFLTTIHLAAESPAQLDIVAHALMGALRGDQSHLEPLRMCRYEARSASAALKAISRFMPPALRSAAHPFVPHGEQPLTHLTTEELAHWFRPPSASTAGVLVRKPVRFSSYAPARRRGEDLLDLGPVTDWGRELPGEPLGLSPKELTRHVFVAGSTGSGKTTTVQRILWALQNAPEPWPFLVLEPAKREYRELFDELSRAGRNPLRLVLGAPLSEREARLRFNPFVAPAGIPIGRHAEALKILLRSCFDMQESLPQLLERVLFRAYADFGFLDMAEVLPEGDKRRFPTFESLVERTVPAAALGERCSRVEAEVRALPYEERVRANLSTALTVRLESFIRGLKGEVFGGEELDFSEVLNRPVFVELSDVNEPDVRRFLLGALFLRICAEREAEKRRGLGAKGQLRHLLVLEEAHHFLREAVGGGPGSELIRQSNALMADAFAELRSYGQGILVADQAPAELAPAVLRNTATKLAHALFYEADCRAMGDAMGLSDQERDELRRLRTGECVVSAPHLPRPVTCRVAPLARNGAAASA